MTGGVWDCPVQARFLIIRHRVAPVAWLDLVRVLRQAPEVGRDRFIFSLSSFAYCHPEQREARGQN